MTTGELGKIFHDGELIVKQGEKGNCMYVIQDGKVEIIREKVGAKVSLARLGAGDFFGEMAVFESEVRSASVRALGEVRVITIDKKNFLSRMHEDPSIAYRIIKTLTKRLRDMDQEVDSLVAGNSSDETIWLGKNK